MKRYPSGVLAGLTVTIGLSILLLLKGVMGIMPDLDVIAMLAGMSGADAVMGWIAHVVTGAADGLVFAAVFDERESTGRPAAACCLRSRGGS